MVPPSLRSDRHDTNPLSQRLRHGTAVSDAEQARALEHAVGLVDDVMGVINLLHVGTAPVGARYPLAAPAAVPGKP